MIEPDDDANTLVRFHLSNARGDLNITKIAEGLPVDVEIESAPPGKFACRAVSVHRRDRPSTENAGGGARRDSTGLEPPSGGVAP
ncbi:hypothetical protein [Nocardia sp. NPDC003726]